MISSILFFALFSLLQGSRAVPVGAVAVVKSTLSEAITPAQLDTEFLDAARFGRMAYCPLDIVANKTCGTACDAIPGYTILASGGDDGLIPRYYVAHDEPNKRIVVAHRGTKTDNILSDLNDLNLRLERLNKTAFPGVVGDGIEVHDGFQQTFYRTANAIMGNVTAGLQSTNTKSVLVVGHSLGAAVAMFDALMLQQQLPADVTLEVKLFGLPRTGNVAWADLIDKTVGTGSKFLFMTNKLDPVPSVPLLIMGFSHSSGEVHVLSSDSVGENAVAIKCKRNALECVAGLRITDSLFKDHRGPYLHNITMGQGACPPFV